MQRLGIQLGYINDLPVVGVVAAHIRPRDVLTGGLYHALTLRAVQKCPCYFGSGCVVQIKDADDAVELKDVKGHVRYDHVSFHYSDDDTLVLSDVSFRIDAGKSIALVGPSGSGKTTICSLLPRFYDVTGGSIRIDGKDIRSLSLESLRNNIGLVQQDVYLFCGSIKDNISYGKPGASIEEIIDAAKKANIHDFIMSLPDGYDSYVGERGTR